MSRGGVPDLGLSDLAALLPGSRVRGSHARGPCPCCPSRTGAWASISTSGRARVGCHACHDWKGVRQAMGLDAEPGAAARYTPPPRPKGRTVAPDLVTEADGLDAVYRAFLRHLPMSADRRRTVLGRDRSVPADLRDRMAPLMDGVPEDPATWRAARRALLNDLEQVAPADFLRRVPELAGREGGAYAVLRGRTRAHYFEPWCDERGRIQALRAYMGKRGDAKYLPTTGRTGPVIHVAFGVGIEQMAIAPWLYTEGWMKAEVAAHRLGCVAVAFPGINARASWRRAVELKQRLAPDAPAFVAFDAETWVNRLDLAVTSLELARALESASGRPAGYAVWEAQEEPDGGVTPKGIDDAIVAGVEVRLVDRHAFGGMAQGLLEREEERGRATRQAA